MHEPALNMSHTHTHTRWECCLLNYILRAAWWVRNVIRAIREVPLPSGGVYFEASARENHEGVHTAFLHLCQEVRRVVPLPPVSMPTFTAILKKTCFEPAWVDFSTSVFQVFRALGGVNGEKRRGGLHLARPKSPNMQELKRRFRQVLSSKVKSATTLWTQHGGGKPGRPGEIHLSTGGKDKSYKTPAWRIKVWSPSSWD